MKKYVLPGILILVSWFLLDYIIHVLLLSKSYEATQHLWRPEAEMKMWIMYLVYVIVIVVIIYMYDKLVTNKSMNNGLLFGLLYGIASGISMGYGTYSVQPIPYHMALIWFLGSIVSGTAAGLWLGIFVKDK